MGDKPVITVVKVSNPFVISELEPYSDAILLTFDVCNSATLDIISGQSEPSALLPFQMPRDMEAVESHCEDAIGDIAPYIDSERNAYDFAFGLNWSGVIDDERVKQYRIKHYIILWCQILRSRLKTLLRYAATFSSRTLHTIHNRGD